jgi:hypothetical protein
VAALHALVLQLTVESYFKAAAKLTVAMAYWLGLYRPGAGEHPSLPARQAVSSLRVAVTAFCEQPVPAPRRQHTATPPPQR